MMEYWNTGIMGSGIMQCWINVPATDGVGDKIRMAYIIIHFKSARLSHGRYVIKARPSSKIAMKGSDAT